MEREQDLDTDRLRQAERILKASLPHLPAEARTSVGEFLDTCYPSAEPTERAVVALMAGWPRTDTPEPIQTQDVPPLKTR